MCSGRARRGSVAAGAKRRPGAAGITLLPCVIADSIVGVTASPASIPAQQITIKQQHSGVLSGVARCRLVRHSMIEMRVWWQCLSSQRSALARKIVLADRASFHWHCSCVFQVKWTRINSQKSSARAMRRGYPAGAQRQRDGSQNDRNLFPGSAMVVSLDIAWRVRPDQFAMSIYQSPTTHLKCQETPYRM